MGMRPLRSALIVTGLLSLGACGLPNNVVVLVPDENGGIGRAVVSATATSGSWTLAKPFAAIGTGRQATQTQNQPFIAERQDIRQAFSKTLEATPRAPVSYVLYFLPGRDVVAPESHDVLLAASRVATKDSDAEISIIGHVDPVIDGAVPGLGIGRAGTVRMALLSAGAPNAAIDISDDEPNDLGTLAGTAAGARIPQPPGTAQLGARARVPGTSGPVAPNAVPEVAPAMAPPPPPAGAIDQIPPAAGGDAAPLRGNRVDVTIR